MPSEICPRFYCQLGVCSYLRFVLGLAERARGRIAAIEGDGDARSSPDSGFVFLGLSPRFRDLRLIGRGGLGCPRRDVDAPVRFCSVLRRWNSDFWCSFSVCFVAAC